MQLIGLTELIKPADVAALIPVNRTIAELKQHLAERLSVPIRKLWWKTTNKRPRKKTPTQKMNGAHTSVAKLLAAAAAGLK